MSRFIDLPSDEQSVYVRETTARLNVAAQIVKKDFWVCWTLRLLFFIRGLHGASRSSSHSPSLRSTAISPGDKRAVVLRLQHLSLVDCRKAGETGRMVWTTAEEFSRRFNLASPADLDRLLMTDAFANAA